MALCGGRHGPTDRPTPSRVGLLGGVGVGHGNVTFNAGPHTAAHTTVTTTVQRAQDACLTCTEPCTARTAVTNALQLFFYNGARCRKAPPMPPAPSASARSSSASPAVVAVPVGVPVGDSGAHKQRSRGRTESAAAASEIAATQKWVGRQGRGACVGCRPSPGDAARRAHARVNEWRARAHAAMGEMQCSTCA